MCTHLILYISVTFVAPVTVTRTCSALRLCHNKQGPDPTTVIVGGDHYTSPKPTAVSDAVNPVSPPVKVPPFEGVDPVQGTPLCLDDLLGDFAVLVTVDAKDPEVAQQILDRLLQVIEGIGVCSHDHKAFLSINCVNCRCKTACSGLASAAMSRLGAWKCSLLPHAKLHYC